MLRCMHTAAYLARQISATKIKVNYDFREWLGKGIFSKSPIGHLYIENRTKD